MAQIAVPLLATFIAGGWATSQYLRVRKTRCPSASWRLISFVDPQIGLLLHRALDSAGLHSTAGISTSPQATVSTVTVVQVFATQSVHYSTVTTAIPAPPPSTVTVISPVTVAAPVYRSTVTPAESQAVLLTNEVVPSSEALQETNTEENQGPAGSVEAMTIIQYPRVSGMVLTQHKSRLY